ncbi:MAG: type I-E CRISPR-associated endoribonuclease Cas2e [Oxalobacter sp.]
MLVLIANNLPPACRGRLKLWFIEVRPSIYVSGLNNNLAEKVVTYLLSYRWEAGAILFKSRSKSPGYEIITLGKPDRRIICLSMMPLIQSPLES